MNDYHPLLQFTIELPVESHIPYLDMMIIKKDNKIITNWHKKETSKGRMLNFHSNHSINIKINTAKGFLNRIFGLSDECFWSENMRLATDLLKRNEYPSTLINSLVHSEMRKITYFRNNSINTRNNNDSLYLSCVNESQLLSLNSTNEMPPSYISLTYIKGLSETLKGILKTKFPDRKIVFKYKNTVFNQLFSSIKDKTPTLETSHVVYCVHCEDCNKKYIGQTSNRIRIRMYNHKSDIKNTGRIGCKLAEHVKNTGHKFDLENVNVLHIEKNKFKREILESIEIQKTLSTCVNSRSDVDNLSNIYVGLY